MDDRSTPPPPPETPPQPPPPHVLSRSVNDRAIAGVCGGLGEYFRVDPLFFRIAFVALSFAGGFGLLLYIIAVVLIPQEGAPRRMGFDGLIPIGRYPGRVVVGVVLLVVAVLIIADGFHAGHNGIWWGAALISIGVLLFVYERREPVTGHPAPPPPPRGYAASFAAPSGYAPFPAATGAPPSVAASPRVAPRPRSVLGLLTVAVAMLAVGIAAVVADLTGDALGLGTALAIALVTVGAGLAAGTWFGRSRALIVLGVLLLPLAAGATLVREPLSGGTGDVRASPQAFADVQREYHLAAGQLTLDLSQVAFGGRNTAVAATVALGQLIIIVPPGVNVDMHGHVGAGEIDLLGHVNDGVDIDSTNNQDIGAASTLHLDLSVGFGDVRVTANPTIATVPGGVPS